VPVNKLDSGVTPAAGMMLEITFDGRILSTYPARFSNIEKIKVLSETAEIAAGDANCDGQVDMSDVVLIMQAFANPDKYGEKGSAMIHLTGLGRLNADMDGDGLTVGDAQSIQKKLLGIGDDPATPVTAQPIGFKDIDAAIDAINKSDVKAYPKAYRNDYLKMFLRIKNDGSIYQLTENETIKAKNDCEVALFPYARYEDIGVGYYVTFKEKNYHIMFYYADADVLAETDGIAEYLKKRMGRGSDKAVRIQDKDVSLLFHENGQCYANAFIDDNHYFDVIGAVSEDELTEFLNAFEYEKLSIISAEYVENTRKLISDFLTENNMCFSVIPASQMPETLRDRYILLSTNGYNSEDVSLFTVFIQENNIYRQIIKSVPYYLDDDSEINEVRKKLFWFVLENNINVSLDYVDEAKTEKYDTVIVKYKQSDKEARSKIEAFLDENSIDHKFVEFRDIE
jgi:hypothetical protein